MKATSALFFIVFLLAAFVGTQSWSDDMNNASPNNQMRLNTGQQPQPGTSMNFNEPIATGNRNEISSTSMAAGYFAFNNLKGRKVKDAQGETLGSIDNVVVGSDGQARYVIISHGGILGIGDTLTPIPWSVVGSQFHQSMDNDNALVVNLTKDQLESAPKYAENGDNNFSNPQWNQKLHAFYPQDRIAMKSEDQSMRNEDQSRVGERADNAAAMSGQRFSSASDLIGKNVQNTGGEKLGNVENIVFSDDGRISYVLLSPDMNRGVLGMTDNSVRLVPVPWSAVSLNQDEKGKTTLTLNIGKDRLANAPSIERNDYADFDNPQWNQRVHTYYEQGSDNNMMRNSDTSTPMDQKGMMQRNKDKNAPNTNMQKGPEGSSQKMQ